MAMLTDLCSTFCYYS